MTPRPVPPANFQAPPARALSAEDDAYREEAIAVMGPTPHRAGQTVEVSEEVARQLIKNMKVKGEESYKCPHCKRMFGSTLAVGIHKGRSHPKQVAAEKPYKCPYCKERWAKEDSVATHVSFSHHDKKSEYKAKQLKKLAAAGLPVPKWTNGEEINDVRHALTWHKTHKHIRVFDRCGLSPCKHFKEGGKYYKAPAKEEGAYTGLSCPQCTFTARNQRGMMNHARVHAEPITNKIVKDGTEVEPSIMDNIKSLVSDDAHYAKLAEDDVRLGDVDYSQVEAEQRRLADMHHAIVDKPKRKGVVVYVEKGKLYVDDVEQEKPETFINGLWVAINVTR